MRRMLGPGADRVARGLEELDPELGSRVLDWAYGDVFRRPELDLKSRELVAVAVLTVLGLPEPLKTHIIAARNAGATEAELRETMLQVALFAGFPLALEGAKVVRQVFEGSP